MSKELEKRLAELLGYTDIQLERGSDISMHLAGSMVYTGYKQHARHIIPQWTENDGAALRLAGEYELDITWWESQINGWKAVQVYDSLSETSVEETMKEHPDKLTAIRIAIVKAVIAKLEAEVE